MLPSPETGLTVTVTVVPEVELTDAIVPVAVEVFVNTKSPTSRLFTFSLNATVNCNDVAFVGVAVTRLIEVTVGAVWSIVYDEPPVKPADN
jgi:hypothetical protein